jgi:E3 ubiquitin-protein ligase UBR7
MSKFRFLFGTIFLWSISLTKAVEIIFQVPRDDEGGPLFEELICQSCSSSLDFLSNYNEVLVPLAGTSKSYKEDISIESNSKERTDFTHSIASTDNCLASTAGSSKESSGLASNLNSSSTERNGFHESATGSGLNLYHCKLKSREESCPTKRNGSARSLFLMRNWRLELCQCSNCCAMYSQKGVSFLIDQDDTLIKYEETAKLKRKEKMEATNGHDLSFLNSLGHTGQIEFLHGLNDMTTELSAFFV